jgi:hypothetical protein
MTTTDKTRKITLTDRPPVKISEAAWPVIASARRHDGMVECQANHEWYLTVREHRDGRRIVYGSEVAGSGGVYQGYEEARAGEIVDPSEALRNADDGPLTHEPDAAATVTAIRRVGKRARCSQAMIDECIAELPAEELT